MADLIDRQAAIDIIDSLDSPDWYMDWPEEARKQLAELPSVQPDVPDTNVGDMISRQAAIDAVGSMLRRKFGVGGNLAESTINDLPYAQPKRKPGKWVKCGHWGRVYKCDRCGNYLDFDGVNAGRGDANFCPECGADMRGEHDG